MKFSIKTLLLLLAVSAVSVTACKKDDEKSAEDNLTGASCWKQTKSETYNPLTSAWEEDVVDACDKDDCTTFNSDKSISFDEGATKCDPADPQTSTGTWALSSDGKTLTLNDATSGISFSGTIVELSSNKLVIEIDILGFKSRLTWQS
ncbi:MAG: lipocalin family protein [Saprospirales bacterium]|nr:lipocalin family protein [Saprospirales bacterium]MBK8923613.1 lipocalin family protein [Saprospirales bacterium]